MAEFTIRPATPADTTEILAVLRSALGDQHGRKTTQFWNWKHLNNPFGPSLVLLAFSGGTLAGVRSMMQWEFMRGSEKFKVWRAVDTATSPAFHRKGIFSKLTTEAINNLTSQGYPMIFNTPNPISAKGYFALGWVPAGKTNVWFKPIVSGLIKNRFKTQPDSRSTSLVLPDEAHLMTTAKIFGDQLCTSWTIERLRWRYLDIPGVDYSSLSTKNGSVIYRAISHGSLTELRLAEIFPVKPDIKADISNLITIQKPDLVTCVMDTNGVLKNYLPAGFFSAAFISPKVICRQLTENKLYPFFSGGGSRLLSAGTMELF